MNRGPSSFQQPEILICSATHQHGWQMEHFPLYVEYFSSYTLSMCMLMVTIFPVFMLFLPTSKKTHTTTCCHNYLCCDQIFTLKMSSINAFQHVFPGVHVHGCFYHLSQNLYRKVQASGLQQLYTEDQQVASAVRMMAALAFVPVNHVVRCFETLQDDLPIPDVLQPVVDYMEDNYIGRPQRRGRRAPKFVE